jgi:hypothetical protein
VIGNLPERFGFEDPEIVDQNVDLWIAFDRRECPRCRPQIGSQAIHIPLRTLQFLESGLDSGSRPPIYNDRRPFLGQRLRNRKSDSRGRSGNQCTLFLQL